MSYFYVGQKVVVVSDDAHAPVGTVCKVAEVCNMPKYIGIRYPHQKPIEMFPYQPPHWFEPEDLVDSPLIKALR